jgi:ATP-dependent Zn protease
VTTPSLIRSRPSTCKRQQKLPGFGSNDEKGRRQLLADLDGFDPSIGIALLTATNRPEILDPALTVECLSALGGF